MNIGKDIAALKNMTVADLRTGFACAFGPREIEEKPKPYSHGHRQHSKVLLHNNPFTVSATPSTWQTVSLLSASAASVRGLRGYTAATWSSGNQLEVMPDVDIGMNKPASNQYENPASETVAPDNVVFAPAWDKNTAIDLGNLAPDKLQGVWRREWIMDGHQSRSGIIADTRYSWS